MYVRGDGRGESMWVMFSMNDRKLRKCNENNIYICICVLKEHTKNGISSETELMSYEVNCDKLLIPPHKRSLSKQRSTHKKE